MIFDTLQNIEHYKGISENLDKEKRASFMAWIYAAADGSDISRPMRSFSI